MIKFIASDLDGTLLPPDKSFPAEIFPLIEQFYEKKVLFAPASGRQYANLQKLFAPVSDKILYIAENGALVAYRGEVLFTDLIPQKELKNAVDAIRSIDGLYPMLCSTDYAYIESMERPFSDYAFASYTHCRHVETLESVMDRPICKIAIYDRYGSAVNCIRKLPQLLPNLRTIISGEDWCDVSSLTANKGEAIRFVQQKFGFSREDCVAFGDHMNDYEMLSECGTAYVPSNGYCTMREAFKQHIPSNAEGGTLRQLKLILEKL